MMNDFRGTAALAVLNSADFDVLEFGPRHAALASRVGVDLDEIVHIMHQVPLALRGADHGAARRQAALTLAAGQGQAMALLPGLADAFAGVMRTSGRHELMSRVVLPMTDALVAALVGIPLQSPEDSMISRVFSETIGIAKRRRMNDELATLRERVALAFPDETTETHSARVAMAVLGRDATLGTIGMTIAHWLDGVTGTVSAQAFPLHPTQTGVPRISRQALRNTQIDGCPVAKDAIVNCDMTSLQTGQADDHARFFGVGAHACLGRRLTMALFAAISAAMAAVTTRVSDVQMTLRRDDVFAIPATIWVTVQA